MRAYHHEKAALVLSRQIIAVLRGYSRAMNHSAHSGFDWLKDSGFGLPFDQIATHANALVVPFRRGKRNKAGLEMGVFSETGEVLPHTEMHTLGHLAAPSEAGRRAALDGADHLKGTWLFCGLASAGFGHSLTRSLGILWALERLPGDIGLLFGSKISQQTHHPVLTQLLRNMGFDNDRLVLKRPTHVDHLVTAPNLFSEANKAVATPEFVCWSRDRITPKYDRRRRRKVYLTRSRLSPCLGRYLNEDVLEKNLEKSGFEIVAPETLNLSDQLRLFAEAETIVAAEGSALHLIPFSMRTSAKLVVIQRRSEVPVLIQNQINSFCPASAHFIDAIDRVYWPQERADNLSLVRLDFEKLRAALIDCGVVKSDAYWAEPNKDEEQDSLYAGRSRSERFLSNEERIVFIRELRNKRRERRQARLSA